MPARDAAGTVYLVFDAQAGTRAKELFLDRIDGNTDRLSRLSADDGFDSAYPDVAVDDRDRQVALTWFDLRDGHEQVYLYAGPLGTFGTHPIDTEARRVTHTPGHAIGAYLAWNGPRIGLAWCDDSVGQDEIYFEDFDLGAAPLEAPRRLTYNRTSSLIPAIVPWRDGFALAWNEYLASGAAGHGSHPHSYAAFMLVHMHQPAS